MRPSASLSLILLLAGVGLGIGFGCSGDEGGTTTNSGGTVSTGTNTSGGGNNTGGAGTGGNGTGGAGTGASTGVGGMPPPVLAECQGHLYECGDIIDNDGDGLIDAYDPDCLGPCDNTEGSYYGGIPGQNQAPCKSDCYFDQDTGPGNDDCYWSHKCDPHEVAPDYYPESTNGSQCAYDPNASTPGTNQICDQLYQAQSQECYDYCGPLTPNGCDCFGCCELPAGSGEYVWLGSENPAGTGSCDIAGVGDPTKCHPCLPVAACLNDCGYCEICIGKPTVPPECNGGTGGGGGGTGSGGGGTFEQCPPGVQKCGLPGQSPCASGFYCYTGCCYEIPD